MQVLQAEPQILLPLATDAGRTTLARFGPPARLVASFYGAAATLAAPGARPPPLDMSKEGSGSLFSASAILAVQNIPTEPYVFPALHCSAIDWAELGNSYFRTHRTRE